TMTITIPWIKRELGLRTLKSGASIPGAGLDMRYEPRSNDWYGRFRLVSRRDNDYEIDRDKQKNESYSGIESIGRQDQACVESMGDLVDRSLEHLAPSDRMISVTRQRILAAGRAYAEKGELPPSAANPDICRGARGGAF